MSNGPPDTTGSDDSEDAGSNDTRVLNIDNLHLHANEIDSLNRLAQTDPELARIVVDQKDSFDRREHASHRMGLITASLVVITMLLCFSWVLIKLGIILSLVMVLCIFVLALFVRVLLTGEWSETSAIGHIVNAIVRALGGTPRKDD